MRYMEEGNVGDLVQTPSGRVGRIVFNTDHSNICSGRLTYIKLLNGEGEDHNYNFYVPYPGKLWSTSAFAVLEKGRPLSALEQSIAAYVAQEKKELGLS